MADEALKTELLALIEDLSPDHAARLTALFEKMAALSESDGTWKSRWIAAEAYAAGLQSKVEELERENERLRNYSTGDWASQRTNDALTIEKYEWKDRALAAEAKVERLEKALTEPNEAALELGAAIEAEWDGRTFAALGRGDKRRYVDRLRAAFQATARALAEVKP